MANWKIYVLINKLNKKMYIGTTSRNPNKRWENGKGYRNQSFGNDIKEFGWSNFEHIVLIENLDEDAAYEIEKFLIDKYKTNQKEFGYNVSAGGKGCSYTPSIITKEKISKSLKNRNGKCVYQYSLDGKFIKEWESAPEAARSLGLKKYGILNSCLGKQNKAYGFIWLYEKNEREALRRIECKRSNFSAKEINEIRNKYMNGFSVSDLAKIYMSTSRIITNIVKQKTYIKNI